MQASLNNRKNHIWQVLQTRNEIKEWLSIKWSIPKKITVDKSCKHRFSATEEDNLASLLFAYAKTKTQISFAVTAKLISAFVFATRIVQSLYFLNTKFQASSHLLWLYSPVCVGPGRKLRRPVFSQLCSFQKRARLAH